LARSGANYQIKIHDGPAVNRHPPSVDVFFHSVAEQAGRNAVGVSLTGVGNHSAVGQLALGAAGGRVLCQTVANHSPIYNTTAHTRVSPTSSGIVTEKKKKN
ncbi:chemotaxis protein CheB, partial [Escherichia coli]|uniref:chemotaxis protein CheB n=1 Tax=Escherichia coli TaxID=562 RepID=UPI0024E0EA01